MTLPSPAAPGSLAPRSGLALDSAVDRVRERVERRLGFASLVAISGS
jgi:hypothetical protein